MAPADPEPTSCPSPRARRSRSRASAGRTATAAARAADAITSGIEVTWTPTPTKWSNSFLEILFGYEWEPDTSPAGAHQWVAKDAEAIIPAPDEPENAALRRKPTMLTTDLALRLDPIYEPISRRFKEHPDEFADAFARAWYKLTHRDMGPVVRYLGPEVPTEVLLWQDPLPGGPHELIDPADIAELKSQILASGLTVAQLVSTAWASAAYVPRQRQARRRQRGANPPGAAAQLGGQQPRRAGDCAADR